MRVGYFQFKPQFGKVNANLKKVLAELDGHQADLIVLPELPFSGYYFASKEEAYSLADDVTSSDIVDSLIALCKKNNFYLVTGFTEKYLDKCFNSSLLLGPEGLIHTYRKIHLFNEEVNIFDKGDIPLEVNQIRDCKIGMMVCFDWVFPEVSRTLALMGAEIICQPANLVLTYCQQTMLTRSLENRVFSITANRFGEDKRPQGSLKFTGKSQIVAPNGDKLHSAAAQKTELFSMDIDLSLASNKMITPHNHVLNDRRPDFYQTLIEPNKEV